MTLQVITASLLKEGLVAYLQQNGTVTRWTSDITRATAVTGDSIDALQAVAQRSEADNIVIAPYAIDVIHTNEGLQAATNREQIRAKGPTIQLPRDSSIVARELEARQAA